MKRFLSLLIVILLATISYTAVFPGNVDSVVLLKFQDGSPENLINFGISGGSDNSTHIKIERDAPVKYGFINVTGQPDGGGSYPSNVELDVGDDGDKEWSYVGTGFGALGKQTEYNDENVWKKLIVPSKKYGTIGKIKLPANATVTKATFDMAYDTNVLEIQPGPSPGKDVMVWYSQPDTSYNSGSYRNYLTYYNQKTKGFIQFNVNSLPANSEVFTADLYLKPSWWNTQRTISIHRVLERWWEHNVTWNDRPSFDANPEDTVTYAANANWKIFNVSTAVINWKADTWSNYGLMFQDTTNQTDRGYIFSSDYPTATSRPKLVINYIKYPINPGLKFGIAQGTPDWSYGGTLKTEQKTTDLKDALNDYLSTATPKLENGNSMVEIPINISVDNVGSIVRLQNIEIEYVYTPRINITAELNSLVKVKPDDPIKDGLKDIYMRFNSATAGNLKVDGLYVEYNHRPVLGSLDDPLIKALPDFNFPEDYYNAQAIDLAYFFWDDWDENTSLTYTVQWSSNPGYVETLVVPGSHYLSVRGKVANWSGHSSLTISCEDSGGRSIISNDFKVILDPVNDKPMANVEIPTINMDEDETFLDLDLNEEAYFLDAESDTIYYDYDVDPLDVIDGESVNVEITAENKVIISGLDNYNADSIPIWIYADDGIYGGVPGTEVAKYGSGKAYNYQEVLLNLLPVNDPPDWLPIDDVIIDEDVDLVNYIDLDDYVSDVESPNDLITYSIFYNENSTKLSVDIDDNDLLSIRFAEANYNGRTYVKLQAEDDGGAKGYEEFNVIVRPINDLPEIELVSHNDGDKVYGRVNLEGTTVDVDGEVQSVEIKIGTNPAWKTLMGTDFWTNLWDTTLIPDGSYDVYIRAIDDLGEYSEDYNITLDVSNIDAPNKLPKVEITSPESGSLAAEGSVTIRGTAIDIDGRINKVEIKIDDGEWIDTKGSIDWFYELDTTEMSNGLHNIYARSHDWKIYSLEENITINVYNPPVVDDDSKGTSDKSSGDQDSMFLYIIIIVIVVIVLVVAAVGVVMRKKKKTAMLKEEEDRKAAEIASVPQVPGLVPLPELPGVPAPVSAPVPGLPAPQPAAQGTAAYQAGAPAPTLIPTPQLPPAAVEPSAAPAPAPVHIPIPQPVSVPTTPGHAPQPVPAAAPAPAAAPYPSSDTGVIDIQAITLESEPEPPGQPVQPPAPQPQPQQPQPQGAQATRPVTAPPQDAYTVELEYSPESGQYKTTGKPKPNK